jgi:stage III sporulation protein AF
LALKNWIINICVVVFFITAVEMILPSNSLKKYAKFVLGLILITVLMNPILKLFDKNFDISTYLQTASSSIESKSNTADLKKYKDNSLKDTLSAFESNLQTSIQDKLKAKYLDKQFKAQVSAAFDDQTDSFSVSTVKVGVMDGTVEKIQKVVIGQNSESVSSDTIDTDATAVSIKQFLGSQLNLDPSKIQVYKY